MVRDYAVIIPIYGEHHFTNNLLDDISHEGHLVDVYLVDNGDNYKRLYQPTVGISPLILSPGENLGWARGTNYGISKAMLRNNYKGLFLMNNDVRISTGFFSEIIASAEYMPLAGIVAPMYDDVWPQQKNGFTGEAWRYQIQPHIHEVNFVDGTCMYVPAPVMASVGLLDTEHFGRIGWGAEMDYALRVREKGYSVYATERAFLNHYGQVTAKKVFDNYEHEAGEELNTGMTRKYGVEWKKLLCLE